MGYRQDYPHIWYRIKHATATIPTPAVMVLPQGIYNKMKRMGVLKQLVLTIIAQNPVDPTAYDFKPQALKNRTESVWLRRRKLFLGTQQKSRDSLLYKLQPDYVGPNLVGKIGSLLPGQCH